MKEVQQRHFKKSSGKSKEVEALIGSLIDQKLNKKRYTFLGNFIKLSV
jgi:vancomycin permeability regulator SanA